MSPTILRLLLALALAACGFAQRDLAWAAASILLGLGATYRVRKRVPLRARVLAQVLDVGRGPPLR